MDDRQFYLKGRRVTPLLPLDVFDSRDLNKSNQSTKPNLCYDEGNFFAYKLNNFVLKNQNLDKFGH